MGQMCKIYLINIHCYKYTINYSSVQLKLLHVYIYIYAIIWMFVATTQISSCQQQKWWVVFFPSFLPKENHDGNCLEASNMAHNGVLAVPVRNERPWLHGKKAKKFFFPRPRLKCNQYPPENQHIPWKMMVGRCISYWNSPFWGDMLIFRGVSWRLSSWWFQMFFIFIPTWGNDPIWLIFFKLVETTN